MDDSIAGALQAGIEKEIARRFDHDDGAMAEYIVVMLQNGKDAPGVTEELKDLIANYDASFTAWIFEQLERLKSGAPMSVGENVDRDVEMDAEARSAPSTGEQGMGYPSARLYSGLKETLQSNGADEARMRHRPETGGVRGTPYGTVAVGNGAMRVPTGPRADGTPAKREGPGPIRSKRGRGDKHNGSSRPTGPQDFPEMPQFPGFPMMPADLFAGMPFMSGMPVPRAPTRRCTKWPRCFKGKACTFGHPTSMCQNANCRKVDGTCPSLHAHEDIDLDSGISAQRTTEEEQEAKALAREQQRSYQQAPTRHGDTRSTTSGEGTTPVCKFGEACTNRTCQFAHPSPASKNGSSIVLNSEFCANGMDCKDENCSFSHPSPSNKYTPGVKLHSSSSEVLCKFNPCLNPSCRFQHTAGQKSGATFGSARNKVWTPSTAKSTSERTFVSGEVEEQFNALSNVHDNDTEMEK